MSDLTEEEITAQKTDDLDKGEGALKSEIFQLREREQQYRNLIESFAAEREKLKESLKLQKEFRMLAENSTDVMVRYDRNLTRSYANPAIKNVLGLDPKEVIGKTNREIGLPQDLADVWDDHLRQAFATGEERILEFWVPTFQGQRFLQSRLIPEFNSNGEVESLLGITRDLTRNKQIEESFRESEKRYRELVENLNEGVWLIDENEITTFVNTRIKDLLGYEPVEIIGKHLFAFMTPEAAKDTMRNLERGRQGMHAEYEIEFICKNGSSRIMHITTTPIFYEQGIYKGALASLLDITRRKRIEKALRQSEARWKSLFHDSPLPIWEEDFSKIKSRFDELRAAGVDDLEKYLEAHPEEVTHMAGLVKILDISQSTAEIFAVQNVSQLSRSLMDYFNKDSLAVFSKELIALWNGADSFVSEISVCRPAGDSRIIDLHLSVIPGCEHSLERILVSFVDITERKQAEEAIRRREQEFRALAERSMDLVARIDRNLYFRYVNPATEGVAEQPPEFFLNKTIFELALPADVESQWVKHLRRVFNTGEDCRVDFSVIDSDNKKRAFDTRLVPEFDANNEVDSVISVTREITRLYEAEEQARETVKKLERLNKLLEEQSRTDSLTGLANRRSLFDYLDKEWRRESRHDELISLIVADIDFFKAYNDRYGHLAGDDCLRRVASALNVQVHRPGDLLARYGGEEFVVVLPETPLSGARELAETMRQAVAKLNIEHQYSESAPYVTISLGTAELAPKNHKINELFTLADEALYRAKASGRNRVE